MVDGEPAGAKKWHVYRYPQEPDKLLILGSILSDPREPDSSLNLDDGIIPVPKESLFHDSALERRVVEAELMKNTNALLKVVPSSLIPGLQGGVEGHVNHTMNATLDALNVRTKWFRPSKEYMELALLNQSVKDFARKCVFSKSLYMIVGVATSSKLEFTETKGSASGATLSAEATLPVTDTALKGEVSHDKTGSLTASLEVTGDSDFAYRVREFVYSRRKGIAKLKEENTKGAMFGGEYDDGDSSDEEDIDEEFKPVPQFEYFEDDDAS
ncbi:hypothetical protein BGZ63DRAFT_51155 [Mariannaea sp. PMI_226]|nr:hypothetical protein BGZ63DRAFT_51155 [Mariannaea sp. PMI_226]